MLFLINRCLLNVIFNDNIIKWSKFPKAKFPLALSPVNAIWKTLLQLMYGFLPCFHFRLLINQFQLIDSKLLRINQMKLPM